VLVIYAEYGGGEYIDLAHEYQLSCNPTSEVLQKSIAVMFRCSSMKRLMAMYIRFGT
jgi:Mor family transcriptional regulator